MFLLFFVVLLVLWLLGISLFHAAGPLFHLLLAVAVIALLAHIFGEHEPA